MDDQGSRDGKELVGCATTTTTTTMRWATRIWKWHRSSQLAGRHARWGQRIIGRLTSEAKLAPSWVAGSPAVGPLLVVWMWSFRRRRATGTRFCKPAPRHQRPRGPALFFSFCLIASTATFQRDVIQSRQAAHMPTLLLGQTCRARTRSFSPQTTSHRSRVHPPSALCDGLSMGALMCDTLLLLCTTDRIRYLGRERPPRNAMPLIAAGRGSPPLKVLSLPASSYEDRVLLTTIASHETRREHNQQKSVHPLSHSMTLCNWRRLPLHDCWQRQGHDVKLRRDDQARTASLAVVLAV